jgi:glucan 1,3-beta-glucosidase
MTLTSAAYLKPGWLLRWRLAALYAVALALLGAYAWQQYKPHAIADLVLAEGERIQCVSYSPHHKPGQTPLNPNFHAPREQIEADLRALAPRFACVRTYSVAQGLDQVPDVARELGMKVLLGAWIGRVAAENDKELKHAIELANRNEDVVRGLIVGNEVLLRREQTEKGLRALIERAKSEVHVPVTYADVWEFWIRHKQLAEVVDFVTVHILPYWEDNPVAVEHAMEHIDNVMDKVHKTFDKPIMIGETGWPSQGRQREGSVPSLVNQARFIREFVNHARQRGWDYNLIEAIDAPWKRVLEGTVGGYWGLLDADTLDPKFDLTGPVANLDDIGDPLISMGSAAILSLALGLAAATIGRGEKHSANVPTILSLLLSGAFAGLVWSLQAEHMETAYRSDTEWYLLGLVAALAALGTLLLSTSIGRSLRVGESEQMQSFDAFLIRASSTMRALSLFAAAVAALLIWVDPRYRDFPYWLYLLPAIGYAMAWRLLGPKFQLEPARRQERILAVVIAIAGLGRLIPEPLNQQAIAWTALCLLLAESVRSSARQGE